MADILDVDTPGDEERLQANQVAGQEELENVGITDQFQEHRERFEKFGHHDKTAEERKDLNAGLAEDAQDKTREECIEIVQQMMANSFDDCSRTKDCHLKVNDKELISASGRQLGINTTMQITYERDGGSWLLIKIDVPGRHNVAKIYLPIIKMTGEPTVTKRESLDERTEKVEISLCIDKSRLRLCMNWQTYKSTLLVMSGLHDIIDKCYQSDLFCGQGTTATLSMTYKEEVGQKLRYFDVYMIALSRYAKMAESRLKYWFPNSKDACLINKRDMRALIEYNRDAPMRESVIFESKAHRNVAMGLSEVCENDIQKMKANRIIDKQTSWAAIKIPGFKVNGTQVGYYFLLQSYDVIELLPPVGASCLFQIDTEEYEEQQPDASAYEATEIVKRIQGHVSDALEKFSHESEWKKGFALIKEAVCDVIQGSRPDKEVGDMAKLLMRRRNRPDEGQEGETPDEHTLRVETWISENIDKCKLPQEAKSEKPEWEVTRLPTPMEFIGVSAVFFGMAPRQENWPKKLGRPPHIKFNFPAISIRNSDIHQACKLVQDNEGYHISSFITPLNSDASLNAKLNAINEWGKCTEQGGIADFLVDFAGKPHLISGANCFPGLKYICDVHAGKLPAPGEQDGDHYLWWKAFSKLNTLQKAAVTNLDNLPYGLWMTTGGAGTGKTETGLYVAVLAVISGNMTSNDSAEPKKKKETAAKKPEQPKINAKEALARGTMTQEEFEELVERQERQRARQERPAQDSATAHGKTRVRMLVVGGMNEQCDDMVHRTRNMFEQLGKPDVKITRLNVFTKEKSRMVNMGANLDIQFDDEVDLNEAETTLMELAKTDRGKVKAGKMHGGDMALCERVKHIINSKAYFEDLKALVENRMANPTEWENNKELIMARMDEAITQACNESDVIVCTPMALIKLFTRFPSVCTWQVVLTEEAMRVPESEQYMQWQCAPNAVLRIMTGDIQQPGPFTITTEVPKSKEIDRDQVNASAQIRMSLMKRASFAGLKLNQLFVNMRARGGVERLVSKQYYSNKMVAEHSKPDEVVVNLREILKIIGGPRIKGSTLLIKPKHCAHDKVGFSPINKTEAAIIKKVVKLLFEHGACSTMASEDTPARRCSILITTPYQEQAPTDLTDSWSTHAHVCRQEPGRSPDCDSCTRP